MRLHLSSQQWNLIVYIKVSASFFGAALLRKFFCQSIKRMRVGAKTSFSIDATSRVQSTAIITYHILLVCKLMSTESIIKTISSHSNA
jgi:hypothetical protein